jgi:hypothetical protein
MLRLGSRLPPAGALRFLVAFADMRDLFIRAKDLFERAKDLLD